MAGMNSQGIPPPALQPQGVPPPMQVSSQGVMPPVLAPSLAGQPDIAAGPAAGGAGQSQAMPLKFDIGQILSVIRSNMSAASQNNE